LYNHLHVQRLASFSFPMLLFHFLGTYWTTLHKYLDSILYNKGPYQLLRLIAQRQIKCWFSKMLIDRNMKLPNLLPHQLLESWKMFFRKQLTDHLRFGQIQSYRWIKQIISVLRHWTMRIDHQTIFLDKCFINSIFSSRCHTHQP